MDPQRNLIIAFLRARPGRPYCPDCIAQPVGLPADQVAMTIIGLRSAGDLHAALETCAECGRTRLVASLAA